jgi:SET domain-containing protein
MALFEKNLVVKKSTLPNAGKGLFTKVFIPKRERIVEYKGRITTWKEVKEDDGENGYIFYIKRYHVIDALPTKKPLARYANDAKGFARVKGLTNNAEYVVDGLKAYIESTKPIQPGSEIFVDYGPDYWKTMRENLAIDRRTQREADIKAKKAKNKKTRKK